MRYSADHKAQTRKHLLGVFGALAKKKGFASTGVDSLAGAAGLTSGAFYSHFASKADLFNALVAHELEASSELFADSKSDLPRDQWIIRQLKRYLNWKHVQQPETGCVAPSLAAEIARSDSDTKKKFEDALSKSHEVWAARLGDEKAAWAVISQLVGSIVVARAMASESVAKKVIESNKSYLEETLLKR